MAIVKNFLIIFLLSVKALKVKCYSVGGIDYISLFDVAHSLKLKVIENGFVAGGHVVYVDFKKGCLIFDNRILKDISFFKKDGLIWVEACRFGKVLSDIYHKNFFWDKKLKVYLLTDASENVELKYRVFGNDSLYFWISTVKKFSVEFAGINEIRIRIKGGVLRYWGYVDVRKGLLLGFKVIYDNTDCVVSVFLNPKTRFYKKDIYRNGLLLRFYSSGYREVAVYKGDREEGFRGGKGGRFVIVLDPGHGGKDPGAIGWGGLKEKDIVLKLALILKRKIEKKIGAKVYLTRDRDVFVPLSRRAEFANRVGADMFISLHCNAHRKKVVESVGVETYILSEAKTSWERAVAAYENSAIKYELEKQDIPNDMINWILTDMAQIQFLKESSELAECIQISLVKAMLSKDRGVKQAGFYVLNKVYAPAVLIEAGFITSYEDAKKLSDPRYLEKIADAIVEGIRTYIRKHAD